MKVKPAYILFALWLVVQLILWVTNGTVTTNEALKYIGQAYHLQQQHQLDGTKYIFYLVPVCVIYACIILRAGFNAVVLIQLLLNAIATAAFYKICLTLFSNKARSFAATALLITFIPLQYWNSFLYTESLFYSFCILFIYCYTVLPPSKKSTHAARAVITLVLLFTRPLGILFLPVTAFYYLWQSRLRFITKLLVLVATCMAAAVLINYLYSGGADMDILMPQRNGFIVCYGDSLPHTGIKTIDTGSPLNGLLYFIFHNPLYFSRLAFYRLLSFFTLTRSYYSPLHNLYLGCCMFFLYVPAVISVIISPLKKQNIFGYLFLPLLLLFCIGVMLQCDDFNSRFCMPLFPFIILLAVDGLFTIYNRVNKTKSPQA
ncbi:MAG TPA: hypothetical protein VG738_22970 [Chitinophagaceae bacterium]|nr:hypothetical protein [Chitinophagaceae bacterium]